MGRIGAPELIFIALIIILLFGAKKLPEIGNALGKAIKEFKRAGKDNNESTPESLDNKQNEQKS